MAKRDYYEVLGVSREAGPEEIKKSFRKLARELHPDVNTDDPDAEERFKEAAEAYEVLSDPERRRTYDAFGHEGLRSGGFTSTAASGGLEDILNAFFGSGSPFGDMFGFGGQARAGGADVGAEVEIALADVVGGVTREVAFDAVVGCEHCNGNGAEPGTPIRSCESCGGAGQIRRVTRTALGQMVQTGLCPDCGGEGKVPETPCAECGGAGRVQAPKSWEVEIPPGIEDGQRIRISGAGHAGGAGAPAGDLYVRVRVAPDERFHREGTDLVTIVTLPATAAMVGATAEVATLDGDRDVEIPAGTQHGDDIRLDGLGLPALHGGRRGDLHVVIKLVVPTRLSAEQRELAAKLDETIGERNLDGDGGVFSRVRRAFR